MMYLCCWSSCALRSRAGASPARTLHGLVPGFSSCRVRAGLAPALVLLCPVQHLPGVRHQQNTLVFSIRPLLRVDLAVIAIAEIDASAAFFRDACCQRNLNTRRFYAGPIIAAHPFNVC